MVMPALVGGFGNDNIIVLINIIKSSLPCCKNISILRILDLNLLKFQFSNFKLKNEKSSVNLDNITNQIQNKDLLGSYLAGLIEGDGTFAIHNTNSTAKKYLPMIIIVFKTNDLPLAEYLQKLTNCGNIYNKLNRGYVLWQIQDIIGIFSIVNLINGKMRTPKIEALQRTINWLNLYIENNKSSNNSKIKFILSKIIKLDCKPLDNSPIESNSWLSGFSDADSNFSINIHKRTNKNSMRVQLFFRIEVRQTYHKLDSDGNKVSFFPIMSILAKFLDVNVYSRSRVKKDKEYYSFIIMAYNKKSLKIIIDYFKIYPLLSSKFLDFKDWLHIYELQNNLNIKTNKIPIYFLEEALKIRKDFNKNRNSYNWDHLNNTYLEKII